MECLGRGHFYFLFLNLLSWRRTGWRGFAVYWKVLRFSRFVWNLRNYKMSLATLSSLLRIKLGWVYPGSARIILLGITAGLACWRNIAHTRLTAWFGFISLVVKNKDILSWPAKIESLLNLIKRESWHFSSLGPRLGLPGNVLNVYLILFWRGLVMLPLNEWVTWYLAVWIYRVDFRYFALLVCHKRIGHRILIVKGLFVFVRLRRLRPIELILLIFLRQLAETRLIIW